MPTKSQPVESHLVPERAKKDNSIESLRGLAIIMVVVGHVVIELHSRGFMGAHHALAYITESVSYLRMPLFTVISGYVYALRPVWPGDEPKFLSGKLRRIGWPLISCGLIAVSYRDFRSDGVLFNEIGPQLFSVYVLQGSHMWYLKALLWIFLLVMVLDGAAVMTRFRAWLTLFLLALIPGAAMAGSERWLIQLLATGNTLFILPYFLLGLGLRRFPEVLLTKRVVVPAAAVFAVGVVVQQLWLIPASDIKPGTVSGKTEGDWIYLEKVVIVGVGVTGTFLVMLIRRAVPGLTWLGKQSYPIFLFHGLAVFGTAAVWERVSMLPQDNVWLVFAAVSAVALIVPVLMEWAFMRTKLTRRVMLGRK